MKPVVQLERTGCGIASVAALAGVTYTEAKRAANRLDIFADDSRLWSETQVFAGSSRSGMCPWRPASVQSRVFLA